MPPSTSRRFRPPRWTATRSEPAETPGTFPVVFRIAAGLPAPRPLEPGEAMAIATGGAVPEGADAVVPIELVERKATSSSFLTRSSPARTSGREAATSGAGSEVVPAGVRIGAAQIGAIGAAGLQGVSCARRPSVAIVTTGSELRPPGSTARAGPDLRVERRHARRPDRGGRRRGPGAHCGSLTMTTRTAEAIERGLELDVLVTSGGVSVGPHDLVRRIEGELGVEEVFWGVAVKPGKPVSFGVRGDSRSSSAFRAIPVSSLVACALFVLPAIEALQGAADPGPRFEWGRLAADALPRRPDRDVFLRSVATTPVRTAYRWRRVRGRTAT